MRGSKLIDFFIALGEDPEVAKQFHKDPNAAMDAAGLSEEEKALVLRGDPEEVRAALGPEYRDINVHTGPKAMGQPTDTHSTHSPGEPDDDLAGTGRKGQTPDTHSTHSPSEPDDDLTGTGRKGQTPDTHSTHSPSEPDDDLTGTGRKGQTPDTHSTFSPSEPDDDVSADKPSEK